MNIAKALNLNLEDNKAILIGTPELTNFVTSEDEPYYAVKLKNTITVRCSIDKEILPQEIDEVFVRKSALESDDWKFVDENKHDEGFYMPNWVVDFSKGQQLALYQETTIAKWTKLSRGDRRSSNRDEINNRIREKMATKKG